LSPPNISLISYSLYTSSGSEDVATLTSVEFEPLPNTLKLVFEHNQAMKQKKAMKPNQNRPQNEIQATPQIKKNPNQIEPQSVTSQNSKTLPKTKAKLQEEVTTHNRNVTTRQG